MLAGKLDNITLSERSATGLRGAFSVTWASLTRIRARAILCSDLGWMSMTGGDHCSSESLNSGQKKSGSSEAVNIIDFEILM